MADERHRSDELVEFIKCGPRGFGSVVITVPGKRLIVCTVEDLLEAVRRIVDDALPTCMEYHGRSGSWDGRAPAVRR